MNIGLDYKGKYVRVPFVCVTVFCILMFVLFVMAFLEYKGQGYIYVIFTIIANTLLYFGFRNNANFFVTFIGIFFWLGFWLKLTFRIAFMGGLFNEPVGNFDGSGAAFDQALLVSSIGLSGLLAASLIREKYLFTYPEKINKECYEGLFNLYINNRKKIFLVFTIIFLTVAVTNVYFGIYQRGAIPRVNLPYGLDGIYKWLLLFGCASISALLLKYEFTFKKSTSYQVVILSLMEGFFSNVSLLSRGMVLNTGALGYGVIKSLKTYNIKSTYRFIIISFVMFVSLFGSSVFLVNYMRSNAFNWLNLEYFYQDIESNSRITQRIFLDRWVGMEAVMAVSSYPEKGWGLWNEAWEETFTYNKLTFYDEKLVTSQYRNTDLTKHHHISLVGLIAFCFYPGSFLFLFVCIFILGLFAAGIEASVFKLGGENIILCSLLAMVVASRYAHFGYVPKQSYLLLGALYLNLFIIYFFNKLLLYWNNRKLLTSK